MILGIPVVISIYSCWLIFYFCYILYIPLQIFANTFIGFSYSYSVRYIC